MAMSDDSTYTTTYTTEMPWACETSEGVSTYTVTETYTGNPETYTQPAVPTGFVTTTVTCNMCDEPTQTIYVPPGGTDGTDMPGASGSPDDGSGSPGSPDDGSGELGPDDGEDTDPDSPDEDDGTPTDDSDLPVVTAGAATFKRGITVAAGIALFVGPIILL